MKTFRLGGAEAAQQTRFMREALLEAGWTESADASNSYDLFWDQAPPTVDKVLAVLPHQRYGHFRGIGNLCAKDRLYNNLLTAHIQQSEAYDFFPSTFHMPEERDELLAAAADSPAAMWIQKPRTLSRGRGIEILRDVNDATNNAEFLVQRYLSSPHLLDGYKYTLRLYVLITSLDPLTVHLFDDGFCKFASRKFSLEGEARTDRFAHLTNPDILREDKETPTSSRNLTHSAYRARLRELGIDDAALWSRIERIVALTMIAARGPMLAQMRSEHVGPYAGFELLGLDVLIDDALRPWLLECNLCPSLSVEAAAATSSAREEHDIKRGVVRETLRLLDVALPPTVAQENVRSTFTRLLPSAPYLAAFPYPRAADLAAVLPSPAPTILLMPDGITAADCDGDGGIALLDRGTGRVTALDAREAEIWRAMIAGTPPRDAAEHDRLATWFEDGLVRRRDTPAFVEPDSDENIAPNAIVNGALSASGTLVRVGGAARDTTTLSPASWSITDIEITRLAPDASGSDAQRTRLTTVEGLRRLKPHLRATPGISPTAATTLLTWLATQRFWDVTVNGAAHKQAQTRNRIAECLAYVSDRFEAHDIWYSLAYGTLLGAIREHDVIEWDYDFDLLVKPDDVPRILALGDEIAKDGYVFEPTRKPPNFLAVNVLGVTSFSTAAIGIFHRKRKIGDLYIFSVFADGVMRRWDFEHDLYWCPHSSFPAYFVEAMTEVTLRGRTYPAVRDPEKWIAGVYGDDWRTPYKAIAQGGKPRQGATVHGDKYEPKLAAEIAWCRERGWDPSRYHDAPAWPPARITGGGPVGPTARTRANTRSLWWTSLDELVKNF